MTPPSWHAVALLAAFAAASPARVRATTPPAQHPGSAPPQESRGAGGREPARQLPRPARPAPPPGGTSADAVSPGPGTAGAGSAAGAPGAPGTPGTTTATEASAPAAATPAAGGTMLQRITGTIDSVDLAARTVQLASADVRLRVGPDARVIRNGRPASLSELRRGDAVRATCPGPPAAARARELDATGAR